MGLNPYQTIADINRIVTDDIREGVSLEYKSSTILDSKNVGAICKAVSALANSAGGQFVTGVESKDEKPVRVDGGMVGASKLDWLHQIINSNTHPAIENVEIKEISDGTGLYYVIDVPVSPKAPHQSNKRYYKRRGPHSDPMEHYEIEDIRSRPKAEISPLRVEISQDGFLALLNFRNADPTSPIQDISCEVDANFGLKDYGVKQLSGRGLRRLAPAGEISFHIGSFQEILGSNAQAEISIDASYIFKGASLKNKTVLCIGDFNNSAIVKPPSVRAMEGIIDKLEKLVDALKPLKEVVNSLERATDGSGVRLSTRTVSSLRGQDHKYDPTEFDYRGYQVIADISLDDAIQFHHTLNMYGSSESKRTRYLDLPEKLREKFEKVFRVDLSQADDD